MSYLTNLGPEGFANGLMQVFMQFGMLMREATDEPDVIKTVSIADEIYDVIYSGLRRRGHIRENSTELNFTFGEGSFTIKREHPYPTPALPDDAIDIFKEPLK